MKKFFVFICVFILVLSMAGCVSNSLSATDGNSFLGDDKEAYQEQQKLEDLFYFEKVCEDSRFVFYRDTVTDVIYIFCRSSTVNTQGGGFVVMLDPDTGLPLTYSDYLSRKNG